MRPPSAKAWRHINEMLAEDDLVLEYQQTLSEAALIEWHRLTPIQKNEKVKRWKAERLLWNDHE